VNTRLIAIFSDLHGNYYGLRCCLDDARQQAVRLSLPLTFWCLGDVCNGLLGTIECLRELHLLAQGGELTLWLNGNHDLAQLKWWAGPDAEPLPNNCRADRDQVRTQVEEFVQEETEISLLATEVGSLDDLRHELPDLWQRWWANPTWAGGSEASGLFATHGMIVSSRYDDPACTTAGLLSGNLAEKLDSMFRLLDATGNKPRLVATGHTHIADAWRRGRDGTWQRTPVGPAPEATFPCGDELLEIDPGATWVVNPGSVGWQRDHLAYGGDPATASYLLLRADEDNLAVCFRRVGYDLSLALAEYGRRGTPEQIIDRVRRGV
jgi:hypothetical protein